MRFFMWALVFAAIAGIAYLCWRTYRNWQAKQRSEVERFAAFIAETTKAANRDGSLPTLAPAIDAAPVPGPAPAPAQEKLLFEAAGKAAEAGEHALSIQLYQRLLARYPGTAFAELVRVNMEAQRRKIASS